ncbi:MAG: response regulator transcription factor [Chryseolinea sp.]
MKKINCIIADDEALARDIIKMHIKQLDRLNIVAICTNGLEVFTAIKNTQPDLVFLDIQMPQLTGTDLLRSMKNPPATIITTAFPEFALEGYELNVIDYLLKPISFERFLKAIDKYETWLNPGNSNNSADTEHGSVHRIEPFIYVKAEKKMVKLLLKDILYMEGLKDYIKIYTLNGAVITLQTLTYFSENLPADLFMRVHRSFIVAIIHISSFSATEINIGKNSIPIGSTYAREVTQKLNPNPS